MSILVTGAAGYIGSHAVQRLLRDGHSVVAVDSLFRGHAQAIGRLRISLKAPEASRLTFVPADVGDSALMLRLISDHAVTAVMHFAALAYVGESVTQPLRYYRNNSAAALGLLEACAASGRIDTFVFSSTCATYGEPTPQYIPIPETCPQSPINPYGWSKLHTERMLIDFAAQANAQAQSAGGRCPFRLAMLRYFNVAGCDRSGVLGEHHEPETHLIPVALQVALGQREHLTIFGTDYPTPDGTCIRDYVHVEDLVDAHVTVMRSLQAASSPAHRIYNLGIGRGYSVREIVRAVETVTARRLPLREGARRAGDPPSLYADPSRVRSELGWRAAVTSPEKIVESAWRWFRENPRGYVDG